MASTFENKESLGDVRAKINSAILNAENLNSRVEFLENIGVSVNWDDLTNKPSTFPPDPHVHDDATTTVAGFMSASDKTKLDGVAAGAQVNPGVATTSTPGLLSAADKTKLNGVETGAQVNPAVATTSTSGLMSATDKNKLDGVQSGAQVNTVTSVAGKTGAVSLVAADVGLTVVSSATDNTAGRLLTPGWMGLGAATPGTLLNGSNTMDSIRGWRVDRVNTADVAAAGGPSGAVGGTLMTLGHSTTSHYQTFTETSGTGRMWTRRLSGGAWSAWDEKISRSQIVGTVSQTSGLPTGSIFESGSNANGEYIRFADGTQICKQRLNLPYVGATYLAAIWTFPAAFVASPTPTVQITMDALAWSAVPAGLTRGDGQPTVGNVFFDRASIQWWTRSGAPALVAGNSVDVHVQVIGRWF